jgi:hypothetical protein
MITIYGKIPPVLIYFNSNYVLPIGDAQVEQLESARCRESVQCCETLDRTNTLQRLASVPPGVLAKEGLESTAEEIVAKRKWLKWRELATFALTPFIKYSLLGFGVFEICFGPKKKHKSIVSSK